MKHAKRAKRGFTLMETTVAAVVLLALLAMTAQLAGSAAAHRRAIRNHEIALCEADNIMERLFALDPKRLSVETVAGWRLSDETLAAIPEAKLHIEMAGDPAVPGTIRLAVVIAWPGPEGEPEHRERLVAWRSGGKL
jgi:prepilin-type N-terminal cleavage/methylation domain-containing protein